jgi:hypothetical protein
MISKNKKILLCIDQCPACPNDVGNLKNVQVEFLPVSYSATKEFVPLKMWVVVLCGLVEVYQCFRGACSLHHQGGDDGCSKHL